ncbi:hypothetical protein QR680_000331 [Steinernema hermaphroditum]|uniref:Uncharacterized protein n=1 Tax=Steinernema hermaphroditum TaxID=289476 RepID=A0AA39GVS0_9BILA|nr:hypothetical protein QR680_000331 [Steinernema hermaphroditum]
MQAKVILLILFGVGMAAAWPEWPKELTDVANKGKDVASETINDWGRRIGDFWGRRKREAATQLESDDQSPLCGYFCIPPKMVAKGSCAMMCHAFTKLIVTAERSNSYAFAYNKGITTQEGVCLCCSTWEPECVDAMP